MNIIMSVSKKGVRLRTRRQCYGRLPLYKTISISSGAEHVRPDLVSQNGDAYMTLLVDSGVVDLGRKSDLLAAPHESYVGAVVSEVVGRTYGGCLEWEVLGEGESEVECAALVWAVGLCHGERMSTRRAVERSRGCSLQL